MRKLNDVMWAPESSKRQSNAKPGRLSERMGFEDAAAGHFRGRLEHRPVPALQGSQSGSRLKAC